MKKYHDKLRERERETTEGGGKALCFNTFDGIFSYFLNKIPCFHFAMGSANYVANSDQSFISKYRNVSA